MKGDVQQFFALSYLLTSLSLTAVPCFYLICADSMDCGVGFFYAVQVTCSTPYGYVIFYHSTLDLLLRDKLYLTFAQVYQGQPLFFLYFKIKGLLLSQAAVDTWCWEKGEVVCLRAESQG